MALPTRVQRGGGGQYDPLETAQREFDTMLNRWFGGREITGGGNGGNGGYLAPYAVDVREDADRVRRATASLVEAVKEQMEGAKAAVAAASPVTVAPIEAAINAYARMFDPVHGGMRRARQPRRPTVRGEAAAARTARRFGSLSRS